MKLMLLLAFFATLWNGVSVSQTSSNAFQTPAIRSTMVSPHQVGYSEVVLIDPTVENYTLFVASLTPPRKSSLPIAVHVLDKSRDGIQQISTILQHYRGLSAVHLVSHGANGLVKLGSSELTIHNVNEYAQSIQAWRSAFTDTADILFYGCGIASRAEGRALLQAIGTLAGADIAASTDPTGHSELGGDWELEYHIGSVEAASAIRDGLQTQWMGLLPTVTFQEGVDSYIGTLDTYLSSSEPDADNSEVAALDIDNGNPTRPGLIRFTKMFGSGVGQIPPGSTITAVSLTVNVLSSSAGAANITLHRMLIPWAETDSWNLLGSGVQADDIEAVAVADSVLPNPNTTGLVTFDNPGLVTTVQAWSSGASNDGWAVLNDHDNHWVFSSSEDGTVSLRPVLSVTYNGATNNPPVADAGGPYTIAEGDPVTLDASLSSDPDSDPLTYLWDVNNDTVFGEVTGATPSLTWSELQGFGITDGDANYTIHVLVDDGAGGTDTDSTTITVTNTPPSLTISGDETVEAEAFYDLMLGATDPGADVIDSWTINWGDGLIDTYVGNPATVQHPYSLPGLTHNITASLSDEDGDFFQSELLVTSSPLVGQSLFRFEGGTGTFLDQFATGDGLSRPFDLRIGPDGKVYLSDLDDNTIRRYDADSGAFIDEFITPGLGGLDGPAGLAFGPDGHLYVAAYRAHNILRFDGVTGDWIDTFVGAGSGGLLGPRSLVFGPDSHLYVASHDNSKILRYSGSSGAFISEFVPSGTGLSHPEQFVFGPDGNLYVANDSSSNIMRFNGTTGAFIDEFIGVASGLNRPKGIAFGPDGYVYVSNHNTHSILRFDDTSGAFIDEYVGAGSGGLQLPYYFTFRPDLQVTVEPPSMLWLNAKDHTDPSDTNLPVWSHGDVVGFGVGATFGQTTTSGLFSQLFTLFLDDGTPADLRALHAVTRFLTLGSGGNIFQVWPGDVIAALDQDGTLQSTNSLTVTRKDVFVFRPDTPGDYTSGTFTLLLDDPVGNNIHALTLMESEVAWGDGTTIEVGSFLLAHSTPSEHANVYIFTATGVGPGAATSGTKQLLLDGSVLGFSDQVQGLDVAERDVFIGDTMVPATRLLMSVDKDVTIAGQSVKKQDIALLDVQGTELGTGTSVTATLLFDGDNVALNENSETLDGLTLAAATDPLASGDLYSSTDNDVLNVPVATGVLANDRDQDGDPLTAQLKNNPINGVLGLNPDGSFTYTPDLGFVGTDQFTYQASDGTSLSNVVAVWIKVEPEADTPSITDASTLEDTQSTSGLVISRHPSDGPEVTHLKITGINGGTLYQNNGSTQINSGDFITFAEGSAGLKFTPSLHSTVPGGFTIQASLSGDDAGLGGATVNATITVTPVGDTPQVDSAVTLEDTQSGLIFVNRHPSDGPEVTHFRISAIASGTLYHADGVTVISNGEYITYGNGQAGLKFTPLPHSNIPGSFGVEASEDGTSVAAQSEVAISTIAITPVGDTPQASSLSTLKDTQSDPIMLDRHAADGPEVTHFRVSNISGGMLYHNDGVTPIADGAFITYNDGFDGIRFTPSLGSIAVGTFDVEASEDGTSVAAQSGVATSTITVLDTNTPPTADAGGPYLISEGQSVVLDASLSHDIDLDPLSYDWDLNGDLIFGDVTGESPTVTWAQLQNFGIDDGDANYNISVRVDDGNGGSDTASTMITVTNTLPVLTASGSVTAGDGSLYELTLGVADPGADHISSWTINWGDGTIDTIAGNPTTATHTYTRAGLTFNILVSATDEDGTVFQNQLIVASYTGDSLFRFAAPSGDFVEEFATADGLDDAIEAIVGPDGHLYVSGEKSDNVLRYHAVTGAFIDEFVTDGTGGLNEAGGIAFGPDGNLYVANGIGDNILRFDGTTGALIDTFVSTASGGLNQPYAVVFGPDGHLYVGGYSNHYVLRYDGTTGAFIDVFVSAGSGGLNTPEQMVFGPDGHLYIASFGSDEILRYDGTTGAFIDVFIAAGGPEDLDEPSGIAFGPDGHLYVADFKDQLVLRYNGSTGAFIDEYVPAGSGGLSSTNFISFLPSHQVTVTTNQPPTIGLPSGPLNVAEGDLAKTIDSSASVSDPDSPNFDGGTLTVDVTLAATLNDQLLVLDEGPGVGNITIQGSEVRYDFGSGPVTIATFTGGTDGFDPLMIAFNASADLTAVEATLRNIAYLNTSEAPSTANRTVRFVLTDGDGGGSLAETQTITVADDNDDPVNTGSLPTDVVVIEDSPSNVDLSLINLEDVDAGNGHLTVTLETTTGGILSAASSGGVTVGGVGTTTLTLDGELTALNTYLDNATKIQYLSVLNTFGDNADRFTVKVTDNNHTGPGGGGLMTLGSVNIDITAVGDTPQASSIVTLQDTQSGPIVLDRHVTDGPEVTHFRITAITNGTLYQNDGVTPISNGSFITYTEGRDGLKFTPSSGSTADGTFDVESSEDGTTVAAQSGVVTSTITVNAGNTPPTANAGGPYAIDEGDPVGLDASLSSDVNGDPLTYRWDLNGDAVFGDVTGESPTVTWAQLQSFGINHGNDTYAIAVEADDGNGGVDTASAVIHVTNSAPIAVDDGYSVLEDNDLDIDWWDIEWNRRQKLTLNNLMQTETLVDFPVLIVLNSSNIDYVATQDAGQDIRFVDANGERLHHEIEQWDEAGNSYVWVTIPQVDGASNSDYIWLYYGNGSVSDSQRAAELWGPDYRAVYHLDDALGASGVLADSTENNFNGENEGTTSETGVIGGARAFNPADSDYIDLGNFNQGTDRPFVSNVSAATISAWIYVNALGVEYELVSFSTHDNPSTLNSRARLAITNTNQVAVTGRTIDLNASVTYETTTSPLSTNTWHYVVGVIDYAGDTIQIYVDGQEQALTRTSVGSDFTNTSTPSSNSTNSTIGAQDDASNRFFDGLIDEVRLASTVRSDDWIAAQYASMTGTFVSFGGQEVAPGFSGVMANDIDAEGDLLIASLIAGPTNAAAFTFYADGTFSYTPAPHFHGVDTFSYQLDDGESSSNVASVSVTVIPVGDTPVVGSLATDEDVQSGPIVIDRHPDDGSEVTHFRIAGIAGGTLYQNDGLTLINAGDYITYAAGQAGLKFTPTLNAIAPGSFDVEASEDGVSVAAQSGVATSTITVNPINDDPSNVGVLPGDVIVLEDTTSNIDLSSVDLADVDVGTNSLTVTVVTTSGGELSAASSGGVTVGGSGSAMLTLFGSLASLNAFIDDPTKIQYLGAPDTAGDDADLLRLDITDHGHNGAGGGGVIPLGTINVDITPVGDTPQVANIATDEDTQSGPIVLDHAPQDGPEITHFKITGITGGVLYHNNGTTLISNGSFITYAEGNTGLKFTPSLNSTSPGSFQVEASEDGLSVAAQSGVATSIITVNAVNDDPSNTGSLPLDVVVTEDVASAISLADIELSDVDAGGNDLRLMITTSGGGTLSAAGSGGVSVLGTGTTTLTLDGTLSALNSYIDNPINIQYLGVSNAAGDDVDSLALSISDNGHSGAGGGSHVGLGSINVDSLGVGDTPQVDNITTAEDTQSGLIALNPHPADGAEVTHFRVSGIIGGSLFLSDGTTPVADGDYILRADGQAGLRFTPALNSTAVGSFRAEASEDGTTVAGQSGQATSTITVTPVNDAPVLDNTGDMTLTDVVQDSLDPLGNSVVSIISSGGTDRITDVDSGALEGIVVIGVDDTNGVWEYSTNSGASWDSFVVNGVANGMTDDTAAVLLDDAAFVRFVPNPSYSGSSGSITFHAWDQTSGASGDSGVDASIQGGTTAYSLDTETAMLTVVETSDVTNFVPGSQDTDEDLLLTFSAANGNSISVDDGTAGDALLKLSLSIDDGVLTLPTTTGLSFESGANGTSAMTVTGLESSLNTALDGLVYTPTSDYHGPSSLSMTTEALSGLIAYYTFENLVDPGYDDSPDGLHDGAVNGGAVPVFDVERGGNVLPFDGVDDYVTIPGLLGQPQQVTIATWVKVDSGSATGRELLSMGDSVSMRTDVPALGTIGFFRDATISQVISQTPGLSGSGWRHVAYTVDGVGNTQALYIDGVEERTSTYSGPIDYTYGPDTYLGRHGTSSSSSYYFAGKLDEARIYNRVLTGPEIANLYAGAAAGAASDTDAIAITVNPVNDAPDLTASAPVLTSIAEDDVNSGGDAIASILGSSVADVDTGAVQGIAIIGLQLSHGTWEYSTNNGASWSPIGAVANDNARLLAADADTRVRFRPNPNFFGSVEPGITFRAWDQTSGANGGIADATASGGATAFSRGVDAASITVNPVGDTPQVANITTLEDTQSGPIVLNKHAADGAEVTHLKISGISGGSLYRNDGVMVIANGEFIPLAEGQAGVRFTPAVNSTAIGSFQVEASEDGSSVAVQSAQVTSEITVTPVGDTPQVASLSTDEDVQSGPIVISRHPADGSEVTHFRITNIADGTLFHSDGTTIINSGDYITSNQGNLGVKFTPSPDSTAPGGFDVESSENGTTVAAQSGIASSIITVTAVNDKPSAVITPTSYAVMEQTPFALHGAGLSVSDIDAGTNDVRVILSVPEGTLDVDKGSVDATVTGTGTTTVTIIGTIAEVNDVLAGAASATVFYQAIDTPSSSILLTLSIDDQGFTGSGGARTDADNASLTISSENSDPSNTGSLPTDIGVTEDVPSSVDLALIDLVDVDAGVGSLTITLATTAGGTLSAASSGGVSVAGSGTMVMTLDGPLSALNTFLDDPSHIHYLSVLNASGDNADGLAISVTDNGHTGAGGGGIIPLGTVNLDIARVGDTPQVASVNTLEDTPSGPIVLMRHAIDGSEVTHFRISNITGGTLYQNDGVTTINNGDFITVNDGNTGVRFTPSLHSTVSGHFNVEASEDGATVAAQSGIATSTITVTPVGDTPAVTHASTLEDTQTTSGLVISRHVSDGAEVTHFRISNVVGGTLYQSDGFTVIPAGAYITVAEGGTGLKFTPSPNSSASGHFDVESSEDGTSVAGQSAVATATITVTPVGDTPSVTNASTLEDTQTTSGLVISRHVSDGPEVTHFRISNVVGGTLYRNDGLTAISPNTYIPVADGHAGLKFTPSPNSTTPGRFDVESSEDGLTVAGQSGLATAMISVTPVGDTPAVTNASTLEDTQTTMGLVISPHAADGVEVTHFRISNITGGTLYQNDGLTVVLPDTYITVAAGQAGLKFTPTFNSTLPGHFEVQSSEDGATVAAQSGIVTAIITITPVNDATTLSVNDVPVSYDKDGPPAVIGGGITISDPDSANYDQGTLQVTIISGGTENDRLGIRDQGPGSGNITTSGNEVRFDFGAGAIGIGTFSGGTGASDPLLVELNANADQTATQALIENITYDNVAEFPSASSRVIEFVLEDGDGESSLPITQTITFGAPPVLWLSAQGDTEPSGTNLDAWYQGDVVAFGSGASLGETTTTGNFSRLFALFYDNVTQANLRAVHYVNQSLILGSGANTFEVQPGDLVAAVELAGTLQSSNALAVDQQDVFVFRPDVPGHYTSGTFTMLLDDPVSQDIHALTLVEEEVTFADGTTLTAGTLLLAHSTPGAHDDIYTYQVTGAGPGEATSGNKQLLLEGSILGVNGPVQGLDLIERELTIGDTTISSTSLLVNIDGNTTVAGQAVTPQDIAILNIMGTEFGTGTAATATLLFDGDNVGLNVATAALDGLTSAQGLVFVANTPSVTNTSTLEDTQTTSGLVISRNPADGPEVTHFRITNITGGMLYQADGQVEIVDGSLITVAEGEAGLRFTPSPDSTDSGQFQVQASTTGDVSGVGGDPALATIRVTPVNDPPHATILLAAYEVNEGTTLSLQGTGLAISDPDAGEQSVQVALTASPGSLAAEAGTTGVFVDNSGTTTVTLNGTIGEINNLLIGGLGATITYTPNATETAILTLEVDDLSASGTGGAQTARDTATITVVPGAATNQVPTDIEFRQNPVDENLDTSVGYFVGELLTIDPDLQDQATYTIIGGTHAAQFAIGGDNSTELILTAGVLDYEVTPVYEVTVQVTDSGGLSYTETFSINVTNLSPVIVTGQSFTVMESAAVGETVGTILTTNDAPTSFIITSGNTDAIFALADNGVLSINSRAALDFESTAAYILTVEASDGIHTVSEAVTIQVADVEEGPVSPEPDHDPSETEGDEAADSTSSNVDFGSNAVENGNDSDRQSAQVVPVPVVVAQPEPQPESQPEPQPESVSEPESEASAATDSSNRNPNTVEPVRTRPNNSRPFFSGTRPTGPVVDPTQAPTAAPINTVQTPQLNPVNQPAQPAPVREDQPQFEEPVELVEDEIVELVSTPVEVVEFIQELDDFRADVQQETTAGRIATGSAVTVTTGLSIGYVLWLLRGGLLLSSLLSSLPAWRFIDPLPIITYMGDQDGDEYEDDSLESMVTNKSHPVELRRSPSSYHEEEEL